MSRHRNIRNLDLDDERLDDLEYGTSVDEDSYLSPTESEFMYQRKRVTSTSAYGAHELMDFISEEKVFDDEDAEDSRPDQEPAANGHELFDMQDLSSPVAERQSSAPVPSIQPITFARSNSDQVSQPGASLGYVPGVQVLNTDATDSEQTRELMQRLGVGERQSPVPPAAVSHLRAEARTPRSLSTSRSPVRSSTPSKTPKKIAKRRADAKALINLVVVGHVDAGKSTLMGHLLFLTGNVNERSMSKFKHESQKMGKASFAFAWVLDETEEERARGVTMDIARTTFDTEHKHVVLLDAPGHKDFIPNMITGAAQADAAILVVNATRGEFETGFDLGGQTREHAMLLRSLGVTQLVVAVNKMDMVDWDEQRFQDISTQLRHFLHKQAGFSAQCNIDCVPVDGLHGINLSTQPKDTLAQWYKDELSAPAHDDDRPLRYTISDVFKGQSGGLSLAGKVETGTVQVGDRVMLVPTMLQCSVKSVQCDTEDNNDGACFAGASCLLTLDKANFESVQLSSGHVLCHASNQPMQPAQLFEAKLVVFNVEIPITRGCVLELHAHNLCEPVTVKRILAKLNKATGAVEKKNAKCLARNSSGRLLLETDSAICVQAVTECKQLSRITLRSAGKTVACGLVEKVIQTDNTPAAD